MNHVPHDPASWPRIGVFGAGAVGCYFGARLAQAGASVSLVARGPHVSSITERGLIFESAGSTQTVRLSASTEPDAIRDADIVLFCVKSRDTDEGARTLARLLRPDAVVVSLQNGVDNVARIREAAGIDALAAVVYVACSMAGPGHVRHAGRGDLVLGRVAGAPTGFRRLAGGPEVERRIADLFERAGVPCPIAADVRVDLWVKLVMNCVFNPISALGRVRYARLVEHAPTRSLIHDVIAECVAVAQADGVVLGSVDSLVDAALALGRAMAGATSSTAQDLAAGRPTEIDSLNGYVARRAQALGLTAPVNNALQAMVKLAESP